MSDILGGGTDETNQQVSDKQNLSAGQFAASFIAAFAAFAIQIGLFLLIKDRFARIYQPRTYLVPERERTQPAPPGWFKWVQPVLRTSNSEFVQKCGLDAYFFLRYLRTLLKIFVPAACVLLPILLPLNLVGGRGPNFMAGQTDDDGKALNVSGLDQLAWGNVRPNQTRRYWGHWTCAFLLIVWICYVSFDELRNYIRMRQAYMTSPQHRLRASATTVLVSSIPAKWCTVEALEGLYDVFPGGLRNIWLNRNFDELSEKISRRDKLAKKLENAETELIRKCFKKHEEELAQAEKKAGKTLTKDEKKRRSLMLDKLGQEQAKSEGVSTNNPHQVRHTAQEALDDDNASTSSSQSEDGGKRSRRRIPVPILGDGINIVGHGFDKVRHGIFGGAKNVGQGVNDTIDTTNGFVASPDHSPVRPSEDTWAHSAVTDEKPINPSSRESTRDFGEKRQTGLQDASLAGRHLAEGSSDHFRQQSARHNVEKSPLSQSSTQHDGPSDPQFKPGPFTKVLRAVGFASEPKELVDYPDAYQNDFKHNPEEALWRKYMREKDRDSMRLPIFGWQWMFSLPLIGAKVDTIDYCREEVARLNVEIEDDQAHPERFPLLNSAFIQFNHQVAAHMACQSVSHHIPKQMAPRIVEIDPKDVIWNNMSIPWWQNYIRTTLVFVVIVGMIVLWAIPVAFTSALYNISNIATQVSWLGWILETPSWFRTALQGILPPALIGLLLFLLPLILRFLIRLRGTQSGMLVELSLQKFYFFFLFVQLFLVISVSQVIQRFLDIFSSATGFTQVPEILGTSIPQASNYFISYMIIQALSVSSGALLQVGGLVGWFILAPFLDSTPRDKFKRQVNLSEVNWGSFFPVYTNLACIGLIYSVISPIILVFNILTFTLFWIAYRYQSLFITRFTQDTGGLLFPNAINCTFVGIYVMEVALIGMFFLVTDESGSAGACSGQAIGMIVLLVLTAIYQLLLNQAFSPLFRYLPITLEDDAVRRDEEFARALAVRHEQVNNDQEGEDMEDQLEANERRERAENNQLEEYEMGRVAQEKEESQPQYQNKEKYRNFDEESKGFKLAKNMVQATHDQTIGRVPNMHRRGSWANRDNPSNRRASSFGGKDGHERSDSFSTDDRHHHGHHTRRKSPPRKVIDKLNNFNPVLGNEKDIEAQRNARNRLADALFSGRSDELEDLTPEQRDGLVQRAFQHSALRARRPCIWLVRDDLGVSDDEVARMGQFSSALWVSNRGTGLDSKGKCVYSKSPPDFSELDLIQL
jgi:calcium permeable stress-gated cation channel